MERRKFIRFLGWGTAALGLSLLGRGRAWPSGLWASSPEVTEISLAFLADAHLPDGDERRPEAQALARAVAELGRLEPAPDLVLFAGDLAHNGDPAALALGQEILAGLPAPLLMVMGEGDGPPDEAGPWRRLFGEPWFSQALPRRAQGKKQTIFQVLGLHTAWGLGPGGPLFQIGEAGRGRLARELERLDPEIPLIILSHAPLEPVFRPWQQWTSDSPEILALLEGFRQVLCLHGHTHNTGASGQWPVSGEQRAVSRITAVSEVNDFWGFSFTENGKLKTENCLFMENGLWQLSLPATAWPQPQPLQGTPARLTPGLGPAGCGWLQLAGSKASQQLRPQIWQA